MTQEKETYRIVKSEIYHATYEVEATSLEEALAIEAEEGGEEVDSYYNRTDEDCVAHSENHPGVVEAYKKEEV